MVWKPWRQRCRRHYVLGSVLLRTTRHTLWQVCSILATRFVSSVLCCLKQSSVRWRPDWQHSALHLWLHNLKIRQCTRKCALESQRPVCLIAWMIYCILTTLSASNVMLCQMRAALNWIATWQNHLFHVPVICLRGGSRIKEDSHCSHLWHALTWDHQRLVCLQSVSSALPEKSLYWTLSTTAPW